MKNIEKYPNTNDAVKAYGEYAALEAEAYAAWGALQDAVGAFIDEQNAENMSELCKALGRSIERRIQFDGKIDRKEAEDAATVVAHVCAAQDREELKPCPFCGETVILTVNDHNEGVFPWSIQCASCGGGTGNYETKLKATAAWNRRANEKGAK